MSINVTGAWAESSANTRGVLLHGEVMNRTATMEAGHTLTDGARAILSMVGEWTRAAFEAWQRRRAIAHTVSELRRLDDHLLKDIGVHRADLHAVARSVVRERGIGMPELTHRRSTAG